MKEQPLVTLLGKQSTNTLPRRDIPTFRVHTHLLLPLLMYTHPHYHQPGWFGNQIFIFDRSNPNCATKFSHNLPIPISNLESTHRKRKNRSQLTWCKWQATSQVASWSPKWKWWFGSYLLILARKILWQAWKHGRDNIAGSISTQENIGKNLQNQMFKSLDCAVIG